MGIAMQFQELSVHLHAGGERSTALDRLINLARATVPGCEWSTITERRAQARLSTLAATGDIARTVDDIQYRLHQGPCLDATEGSEPVHSADLGVEIRWPQFCAEVIAATPVRAILSFHLGDGPPSSALNLYAAVPDAFVSEAISAATLFAVHARVLMIHAESVGKAANLAEALTTSRQIGAAIGILMAAHKVTNEHAFDLLRASSQTLHRKLRDIAAEVTDTGALPAERPGGRAD